MRVLDAAAIEAEKVKLPAELCRKRVSRGCPQFAGRSRLANCCSRNSRILCRLTDRHGPALAFLLARGFFVAAETARAKGPASFGSYQALRQALGYVVASNRDNSDDQGPCRRRADQSVSRVPPSPQEAVAPALPAGTAPVTPAPGTHPPIPGMTPAKTGSHSGHVRRKGNTAGHRARASAHHMHQMRTAPAAPAAPKS